MKKPATVAPASVKLPSDGAALAPAGVHGVIRLPVGRPIGVPSSCVCAVKLYVPCCRHQPLTPVRGSDTAPVFRFSRLVWPAAVVNANTSALIRTRSLFPAPTTVGASPRRSLHRVAPVCTLKPWILTSRPVMVGMSPPDAVYVSVPVPTQRTAIGWPASVIPCAGHPYKPGPSQSRTPSDALTANVRWAARLTEPLSLGCGVLTPSQPTYTSP